jgi:hypothetical protein
MRNEHPPKSVQSLTTQATFSSSVQPNRDGGWLTVVNLGDGASLTKWFASKDEANRYPDELAAWLTQGRE